MHIFYIEIAFRQEKITVQCQFTERGGDMPSMDCQKKNSRSLT